jgi:diaminobutyrate acetyltransferase
VTDVAAHVTGRTSSPTLRHLDAGDGARLHRAVRDGGGLDVNSPYAYELAARTFPDTSVLAEGTDGVAGFVIGLTPPRDPGTLFVWQVGVATAGRGRGLGGQMLRWLVARVRPTHLEATVAPSNAASRRLFAAVAEDLGAPLEVAPWASATDLGGDQDEDLHRIGPLVVAAPG